MLKLENSLCAWKQDRFPEIVKKELLLNAGILPLDRCVLQGGIVDAGDVDITLLKSQERETCIQVDIGIFFNEIVGGCSCGDDPYTESGYCEMQILIDKSTAEVEFRVVPA